METALTISSYQSVPPPSSQSQVGIGQQNTIVGERGHTVSVYIMNIEQVTCAPNEFTTITPTLSDPPTRKNILATVEILTGGPEMSGENGQLRINTLMINAGLTDKDLDQAIVEKDLSKIADLFDSVDDLCEQFGLSKADMADVETQRILKGTKESVKKALEIWRNRYPSEATFKNLLIILLDSEKGVVAKDVANYISKRISTRTNE